MKVPAEVLFGLALASIALIFVGVRNVPRLLQPIREADRYSERGGATWGRSRWRGMNVSWPFAKLTVSPQRLVIEMLAAKSQLTFERHEVLGLREVRGVLGKGVAVEHVKSGVPPRVVFWTFDFARTRRELEHLGYAMRVG